MEGTTWSWECGRQFGEGIRSTLDEEEEKSAKEGTTGQDKRGSIRGTGTSLEKEDTVAPLGAGKNMHPLQGREDKDINNKKDKLKLIINNHSNNQKQDIYIKVVDRSKDRSRGGARDEGVGEQDKEVKPGSSRTGRGKDAWRAMGLHRMDNKSITKLKGSKSRGARTQTGAEPGNRAGFGKANLIQQNLRDLILKTKGFEPRNSQGSTEQPEQQK